jgi:hypothetical protein
MKTFKMETERRVRDLQKSLERLLKKFESDMQQAISSMYEKNRAYLHIDRYAITRYTHSLTSKFFNIMSCGGWEMR